MAEEKKAETKKPEPKRRSAKEDFYGKKEGAEGSPKEERSESPAEAKAEGDKPAADPGKEMIGRHHTERANTAKRHEEARRDMHGGQREELRNMEARHMAEMMAMQQGAAAAAPAAAPAAPAPAPAAPMAAMAAA